MVTTTSGRELMADVDFYAELAQQRGQLRCGLDELVSRAAARALASSAEQWSEGEPLTLSFHYLKMLDDCSSGR